MTRMMPIVVFCPISSSPSQPNFQMFLARSHFFTFILLLSGLSLHSAWEQLLTKSLITSFLLHPMEPLEPSLLASLLPLDGFFSLLQDTLLFWLSTTLMACSISSVGFSSTNLLNVEEFSSHPCCNFTLAAGVPSALIVLMTLSFSWTSCLTAYWTSPAGWTSDPLDTARSGLNSCLVPWLAPLCALLPSTQKCGNLPRLLPHRQPRLQSVPPLC